MQSWLAILASVAGATAVLTLPPGAVEGVRPDSVTPGLTFRATGGAVTSRGLYTAGAVPGAFRVVAFAGAAADTAAVTVAAPVARPALAKAGASIPFGFFNAKPAELAPPFDVTVIPGEPARLLGALEDARRRGTKVIVNFAGGKYSNNYGLDGTFSLDVWKSRVDQYARLDLQPYIADGTLMAHYLIDEPHNSASWGGRVVPYETLEQMAQHSKTLWPDLPTVIRTRVSWLAQAPFRWTYLDAGWSQFLANRWDISQFRDEEIAASSRSGLALLFSLNILDGGQKVPGCYPGTKPKWCKMTAAEVARYGTILGSVPAACALTLWRYNPEYLARSDIQASLQDVARVVAAHPPRPCRRQSR